MKPVHDMDAISNGAELNAWPHWNGPYMMPCFCPQPARIRWSHAAVHAIVRASRATQEKAWAIYLRLHG